MSSYFSPGPDWLLNGTPAVPIIRPSLAGSIALTAGVGAWTLGAYVQMAAAADLTSHMLIGLYFFAVTDQQNQVEIASGGAGTEVVFWRTPVMQFSNVGYGVHLPVMPFAQVPASARVAARLASGAGNPNTVNLFGLFLPRPLA